MDETVMEAPKRVANRGNGQKLTRRRVPLSCVACRVRKLKCNREKPCQNCIVRGEGNSATCSYSEKPEKKHHGQKNSRSDAEDMRKRLSRLENSILSMMSSGSDGPASPDADSPVANVDALDQAGGQMISSDTRSTHWDAILNDLGAMKDAWNEENDKVELASGFYQPPVIQAHRPGLLSGLTSPPDRSTILESLPSKSAADKLLGRFFDSYNPAMPARYVLHKSTFLRQYNQHWADPTKTKIIWIGLLYSVLCLAMLSHKQAKDTPPEFQREDEDLSEIYRIRTAQCLIIADIHKPCEFMIETLDLHSFAEYANARDSDMGVWILSGIMMRLALQQGYHRDPSQMSGISVFQGEMRRRIWSAVSQHELLFSVQIGLPKAIRYSETDSQSPRNIHEEELHEDMTVLPPSRPWTVDTQISYQVVKYHLMRSYGQVVEFVHVLEPQPYEDVMKLDMVLLETRQSIPPHLQLGTLQEMRHDASSRVMEKYILQLFWHKAVCVLHRNYWDSKPVNAPEGGWSYSRLTSVQSALTMLDHQHTMHQASAPGGCLENMKWYRFSITNHDFLLAAMIICLDLMNTPKSVPGSRQPECLVPTQDKLLALQNSRSIWVEVVDECKDAKRAVKILTAVLKKLSEKVQVSKPLDASRINLASPPNATNIEADSLSYNPSFTDNAGLSNISSLTDPPLGSDTYMQDNFLDTYGMDPTVPIDFDWIGWDQFVNGQTQQLTQDLSGHYEAQNGQDFMPNVDYTLPYNGYINRHINGI